MSRSNGNIFISGADIAGPALASWLRRYGFIVIVVEQASQPPNQVLLRLARLICRQSGS